MKPKDIIKAYYRALVEAGKDLPASVDYVEGWYRSDSWFGSCEEPEMLQKIEELKSKANAYVK